MNVLHVTRQSMNSIYLNLTRIPNEDIISKLKPIMCKLHMHVDTGQIVFNKRSLLVAAMTNLQSDGIVATMGISRDASPRLKLYNSSAAEVLKLKPVMNHDKYVYVYADIYSLT